jgi:hypothetical protein
MKRSIMRTINQKAAVVAAVIKQIPFAVSASPTTPHAAHAKTVIVPLIVTSTRTARGVVGRPESDATGGSEKASS